MVAEKLVFISGRTPQETVYIIAPQTKLGMQL